MPTTAATIEAELVHLTLAPVRLLATAPESAAVQRLTLDVSGHPLAQSYAIPGQYVALSPSDSSARYFAIASAPPAGATVDFLIGRGSPTSDGLCNALPGDQLHMSAALGTGYAMQRIGDRPVVAFTSGTGVASVRPVIQTLLPRAGSVALFHSRSGAPLDLLEAEFGEWAAAGVHINTTDGGEGAWVHDRYAGWAGRWPAEETAFVVCGSARLQESVVAYLRALGVPSESIFFNY
jgi:NAD(P)H-flavin reductase